MRPQRKAGCFVQGGGGLGEIARVGVIYHRGTEAQRKGRGGQFLVKAVMS